MDYSTLQGLSTVFMMIAFIGICWWAFGPSRKKQFDDAANLPFTDGVDDNKEQLHSSDDEERQG